MSLNRESLLSEKSRAQANLNSGPSAAVASAITTQPQHLPPNLLELIIQGVLLPILLSLFTVGALHLKVRIIHIIYLVYCHMNTISFMVLDRTWLSLNFVKQPLFVAVIFIARFFISYDHLESLLHDLQLNPLVNLYPRG